MARRDRFSARATLFAQEFPHWFDADETSLAFADVEALPWGQIKGLWALNLRCWGQRDCFFPDGIMPVGNRYPNLHMCVTYNSPGSPNWVLKAHLLLALPEDHPFWTSEEIARVETSALLRSATATAGMLEYEAGGNRVLLPSCNEMRMPLRGGPKNTASLPIQRFSVSRWIPITLGLSATHLTTALRFPLTTEVSLPDPRSRTQRSVTTGSGPAGHGHRDRNLDDRPRALALPRPKDHESASCLCDGKQLRPGYVF